MTYKEAEKVLKKDGWQLVRTKGSHNQFKKPGVDYLATLPNHAGKDISIGVLRSLEKGTGLSLI